MVSVVQRVYDETGHSVACDVTQLGAQFGDGVFETLLVAQGNLPFVDLHLSRLMRGLDTLSIKLDAGVIINCLGSTLAHAKPAHDYRLRVQILRALPSNYNAYSCDKPKPLVVIRLSEIALDLSESQQMIPVDVANLPGQISSQPMLAGLKHCNRLEQVLFKQQQTLLTESWSTSIAEGLVYDQFDNLVEAIAANVFLKVDGRWMTPSIQTSGVAGVAREFVLEQLAVDVGIDIEVTTVSREQVANATAMFLTNAVKGIVMVDNIWMRASQVVALNKDPDAARLGDAWQLAVRARRVDLLRNKVINSVGSAVSE